MHFACHAHIIADIPAHTISVPGLLYPACPTHTIPIFPSVFSICILVIFYLGDVLALDALAACELSDPLESLVAVVLVPDPLCSFCII